MRKFAGATTPCQSKAAVTRLMRSPLAAKNVATTRRSISARNAIGSRSASRGDGQPALSLRAASSAAFDMRAPQRLRHRVVSGWRRSRRRSQWPGRCGSPLPRSRRRRPSSTLGSRSSSSGMAAASDKDTEKNERRRRAPSGGSASQSPAQDNARNKPSAVASDASAGHSRSQNMLPRARCKRPREQRCHAAARYQVVRPSRPNNAPCSAASRICRITG